MGKKKDKPKKKCCGKYLKTARHCKGCPLLKSEVTETKEKKSKKNKDKAEKKEKKKK